jgi:protein phosphatase
MSEIEFFQLTAAGPDHAANRDAVGCWPHDGGLLFAVARGFGGTRSGAFASALALEVLAREMELSLGSWPLPRRLRRAVQQANHELYGKAVAVPALRGMGTTLTATAIVGDVLVTAHVGDCRLFRLRDRTLEQLTKDHTWVWERVEHGLLSPAEAAAHPGRHVVTRCLGRELVIAVDVLKTPVRPGDVLVQCTDGVHAALAEEEIADLAAAHPPEPACRALARRARADGSKADVSAQVAAIRSGPTNGGSVWRRFRGR